MPCLINGEQCFCAACRALRRYLARVSQDASLDRVPGYEVIEGPVPDYKAQYRPKLGKRQSR